MGFFLPIVGLDISTCNFFSHFGCNVLFESDYDASPDSLMDSTTNPKGKTTKGKRIKAHSLAHSTLRVEGHVKALG